jgi:hypothetical protein
MREEHHYLEPELDEAFAEMVSHAEKTIRADNNFVTGFLSYLNSQEFKNSEYPQDCLAFLVEGSIENPKAGHHDIFTRLVNAAVTWHATSSVKKLLR